MYRFNGLQKTLEATLMAMDALEGQRDKIKVVFENLESWQKFEEFFLDYFRNLIDLKRKVLNNSL